VLADGDEVGTNEFPQIAQTFGDLAKPPAPAPDLVPEAAEDLFAESVDDASNSIAPMVAAGGAMAATASSSPTAVSLLDAAGECRPLDEVERDVLRFAIAHYRGQMSEVARRLRIGRSTLYRKLDAINVNAEHPAG
jgi:DNA-binding NtrC family response regulator